VSPPPLSLLLLQAAAQAVSTEEVPIRVQLIALPLYVMTTQCLEQGGGHRSA